MRKKVTYIAFDGKEFDTEMKCREHEESRRNLVKVCRAIDTIKNYCRESGCGNCPFFGSLQEGCKFMADAPEDWEV